MEPTKVTAELLANLLLTTKDGDWGEEGPHDGYASFHVIRGADFPAVRVGDVSTTPVRYLEIDAARRRTLISSDIIIETAGGNRNRPTGRTLLITERLLNSFELPVTCASFCRFLRVDPAKAFPPYVFWYLQYMYSRGEMWEHQVQHTGVARFQYTKFAATTPIPLPAMHQQRAIAHVLGTLDDKIELNWRMNETLEAISQALFKSWFVDRTQNGLPEGWQESTIREICEFAYGKALKEETRQPGSVPVYGSNGQVGWHNERLVRGPGIVVGRKGNPGIVTWAPTDFFPIDTTFYVVPKDKCRSLYFLFFTLRAVDLASLSADSAVPGLNRNMAYMSEIVAPPQSLLSAFDDEVRPLFERIHSNNEESRTIASLRDALLPKLLSGPMRVQSAGALTV